MIKRGGLSFASHLLVVERLHDFSSFKIFDLLKSVVCQVMEGKYNI
jgi:hypothetical protein